MKKQFVILSLATLSLFSACIDNGEDIGVSMKIEFKARSCNKIFAVPGSFQYLLSGNGVPVIQYSELPVNATVESSKFALSIQTSNVEYADKEGLKMYFPADVKEKEASDLQIEEQVKKDIERFTGITINTDKPVSNNDINLTQTIEYRTTGISKVNITALDAMLFGQATGESLNKYFEILSYEPQLILSSTTKKLLYGMQSTMLPNTIEKWLELSPMAQTSFFLKFTEEPKEQVTTRLKVEMETVSGEKLSYITKSFKLIVK